MGARLNARSRTFPRASAGELPLNMGALAARTWLAARGLSTPMLRRWHATVLLAPGAEPPRPSFDEARDTRFHLELYSEEWGVFFCHRGRASWVRVTDIAFVHGRDDHKLLAQLPSLDDIGSLLRALEHAHGIGFRRDLAVVRTNVPSAEPAITSWVRSL